MAPLENMLRVRLLGDPPGPHPAPICSYLLVGAAEGWQSPFSDTSLGERGSFCPQPTASVPPSFFWVPSLSNSLVEGQKDSSVGRVLIAPFRSLASLTALRVSPGVIPEHPPPPLSVSSNPIQKSARFGLAHGPWSMMQTGEQTSYPLKS